MARIRTIKPEFWEDEVVGMLSLGARLLFIGSWNLADDEGLLRWTPEYLKASVFMYDHGVGVDEVSGFMQELEDAGLVFGYIGGKARQRLGWIVKFLRHQKINRPQPGRLPPPSLQNAEVRRAYAARDGWICHVCNREIGRDPTTVAIDDAVSCDHVTPKSKGGSDYPSNILATHLRCNKSKKDRELPNPVNNSLIESVNRTPPEGNGRDQGGGMEGEVERSNSTHTPRARSADVENSDPLAAWLGEFGHVLDECPPARTPETRAALFQHFGPPGLRANAWRKADGSSVPIEDRPRLLALAISGYAGEGKHQVVTAEFAGMLRRVVHDETQAIEKPGSVRTIYDEDERAAS